MMHQFYEWLIPAIWIAWTAYWLIAGVDFKPVVWRESALQRASHVLPTVAGVLVFVTPDRWYGPLAGLFLARGPVSYWVGVAILAVGLGFSVYARRYLGGNWSGTVTVKVDHELVRNGPYRWVRHPIYTGILGGIAGCALALGEWRGLLAFGIILVATYSKLRREECWMTARFGRAYAAYRREVRGLVPFIV